MTTRPARSVRSARRARRSVGLVALAAAAALSLTACQGGGNDSGKSTTGKKTKNSSSVSHSTGGGDATGGAKTGSGTKTENGATTGTGTKAKNGTAAKAGAPDSTQTLVDGSKAQIYKLGDQHYRADIVSRGSVLGTLETNGHDDGVDANDMFVVLTLGGEVHSWMGGGNTGPGTFELAGGWTAKVKKVGEAHYTAQILGNEGDVEATMDANQHDAGLDANGIYIVLTFGGEISAHE
ncbi:hypothetical protein QF026_004971 [Streptomyces aurantiacus]|uniref:hypothetical protein n=1 Tax=Streptomyces aurantiacus TaxID=47760 RepID=UPI00278FFD2E|nr:hypothetical protein [Streptomyces aurantiacus]MDQ0776505.1 hypothetical protein [Streptomyces aurantiacus]